MIKTKHGDTLIEVTIAIGIFSMIAIAVASVMSSGTSGSQMALETTLAREEIDAQAEALRFVHSSFVSSRNGRNSTNDDDTNPYRKLWRLIADNAITGDEITTDITQYSPNSCDELYAPPAESGGQSILSQQKAFVLNVKQLSGGEKSYYSVNNAKDTSKFTPATTYPRLIFADPSGSDDANDSLVSTAVKNELSRAEGIYVVAVKDADSTQVVNGNTTSSASAFYDFYIRTCWYGTDATRPSTISTVIRLYNPEIKPAG